MGIGTAIRGGLEGLIERATKVTPDKEVVKNAAYEFGIEAAVEYAVHRGLPMLKSYTSGLTQRLEEAATFYATKCKGDIQKHQLDELASIVIYGTEQGYKTGKGIKKAAHKTLANTMKIAKVDRWDNWKITRGMFQKGMNYIPEVANDYVGKMQNLALTNVSNIGKGLKNKKGNKHSNNPLSYIQNSPNNNYDLSSKVA